MTEDTTVVTSGFTSDRGGVAVPARHPDRAVTRVDLDEVELYQRVHIKPFADLRRFDFVQVLTRRPRHPGRGAPEGSAP